MCNVPDILCSALIIAMTLAMLAMFALIVKSIWEDR